MDMFFYIFAPEAYNNLFGCFPCKVGCTSPTSFVSSFDDENKIYTAITDPNYDFCSVFKDIGTHKYVAVFQERDDKFFLELVQKEIEKDIESLTCTINRRKKESAMITENLTDY